jgi:hypothetical protein
MKKLRHIILVCSLLSLNGYAFTIRKVPMSIVIQNVPILLAASLFSYSWFSSGEGKSQHPRENVLPVCANALKSFLTQQQKGIFQFSDFKLSHHEECCVVTGNIDTYEYFGRKEQSFALPSSTLLPLLTTTEKVENVTELTKIINSFNEPFVNVAESIIMDEIPAKGVRRSTLMQSFFNEKNAELSRNSSADGEKQRELLENDDKKHLLHKFLIKYWESHQKKENKILSPSLSNKNKLYVFASFCFLGQLVWYLKTATQRFFA